MNRNTPKARWWNKRRVTASILAVALIIAMITAGTMAWTAISQNALNETKGTVNLAGGRLHDDFDGENKDIYVENYGNRDLFVRVQLYEYMEIGGVPFKSGADKGDYTTWSVHIPDADVTDCGEVSGPDSLFHDYWEWTMGGKKVYMPTFNKDNSDLKSEVSGSASWDFITSTEYEYRVSGGSSVGGEGALNPYGDGTHDYWHVDDPKTAMEEYSDPAQDKSATHYAQETIDGGIMTMAAWISGGCEPGDYWVIDEDGWCYWANRLKPGTATGLLLDSIEFLKGDSMTDDWYYAIFADAQFSDEEQLRSEFLPNVNNDYTNDGEMLLYILAGYEFGFKMDTNLGVDPAANGAFGATQKEVILQIGNDSGNFYWVDWGDGSSLDKSMSGIHTYDDDEEYEITIYGLLPGGIGFSIEEPLSSGAYYGDWRLTEIKNPLPAETGANFSNKFHGCKYLTTIPADLFAKNPQAANFEGVFAWCENLAVIPSGLFDYNVGATDFSTAFSACSALVNIPSGLFDNNPAVLSFYNTFASTAIVGIPANLFDNNPLVTDFSGIFVNCVDLLSIPEHLFDNNLLVTDFSAAFQACLSLEGIPADLFKYNDDAVVINFDYTFTLCEKVEGLLPELWISNPSASHDSTFFGCDLADNYDEADDAGWC